MKKMTPEELDAFSSKPLSEQLEECVADAFKEGVFRGLMAGIVTGFFLGTVTIWLISDFP